MKMQTIDLNADMGEYADTEQLAVEAALMPLISSCSIACGGHAGDDETMRNTARLAKAHGVSIGAHPAYPDREGFGRQSLALNPDDLRNSLRTQIGALKLILDAEGMSMRHIKPHGALYNDASRNADLAQLIAELAGDAVLVGAPGSAFETASKQAGCTFAPEGFVDRLYLASGALTPRSEPGAIITDMAARTEQALALAHGGNIQISGGTVQLSVQTLCIHSDTPGAVKTAQLVRTALQKCGFEIRPFS